jgi:hypothetical protein
MIGNPACANYAHGGTIGFFDADTGAELHLVEAYLSLTVAAVSMIDFREVNSSLMVRAEMVPPPANAAWSEYAEQTDSTLAVLAHKLADKAADTAARNAPPLPKRTGGVVQTSLRRIVRRLAKNAVDSAIKQLTCGECMGTGWYQGLHRREPCSKGCKPQ